MSILNDNKRRCAMRFDEWKLNTVVVDADAAAAAACSEPIQFRRVEYALIPLSGLYLCRSIPHR